MNGTTSTGTAYGASRPCPMCNGEGWALKSGPVLIPTTSELTDLIKPGKITRTPPDGDERVYFVRVYVCEYGHAFGEFRGVATEKAKQAERAGGAGATEPRE